MICASLMKVFVLLYPWEFLLLCIDRERGKIVTKYAVILLLPAFTKRCWTSGKGGQPMLPRTGPFDRHIAWEFITTILKHILL